MRRSLPVTLLVYLSCSLRSHSILPYSVQSCPSLGASLVAQTVKNLPAMRELWVQSLGREDPLEEGMVTHSSIPAWRIAQTEEPGRLQSMGSQTVGHD